MLFPLHQGARVTSIIFILLNPFHLTGIISAITWPTSLLTLASVIDNPWGVCCRRSAQVGKQLAEVLIQRQHGKRPVTLIGFSLGARVIYYCLQVSCFILEILYVHYSIALVIIKLR